MKNRVLKVIFILGMLFFLNFVSASITVNQPLSTYNFGDTIFLNIEVNPAVVSGNFEINLVCDSDSINFYKISPAEGSFSANKNQKVTHKIVLTKEFIGDLKGNCHINTHLGSEFADTTNFLLTDEIALDVELDKYSYRPGEMVVWNIDALKANGLPLNGFVEVSGKNNFTKQVIDGKSRDFFVLSNNTAAGRHDIVFFVFDKIENEVLNKKTISASYEIVQIPSSINLNLLNFDAVPGKDYEFAVDLFDQTGNKMSANITATYVSSNGKQKQVDVASGNIGKITIAQNELPGKYSLTVSSENLEQTKEFNVLPLPKINLEFLQDSSLLIVTNVGNVPYVENLNIDINGVVQSIPVYLEIGEEKRFNIRAQTGQYEVAVSSGEAKIQKSLLLTGNAISIKEWNGLSLLEQYAYIWVFIVVIIILAAIVVVVKYYRNKTFKFGERIKPEKREDITVVSAKVKMQKDFVDLGKSNIQEAQSSLAMSGNKNNSSLVVVSIKNLSSLGNDAKTQLNFILTEAKGSLGVLEWKASHALIIVSPLLTKTYKNEIIAAKIGWKIHQSLEAYNKRFNNKINYNIGLHCGEMISSLKDGKLNYTSLGNTMILTKRISDLSDSKLLASGIFRQKLIRELKVNPFSHALGDLKVFEVTRIADTEANADKLRDLMKRNSFSTGNFD